MIDEALQAPREPEGHIEISARGEELCEGTAGCGEGPFQAGGAFASENCCQLESAGQRALRRVVAELNRRRLINGEAAILIGGVKNGALDGEETMYVPLDCKSSVPLAVPCAMVQMPPLQYRGGIRTSISLVPVPLKWKLVIPSPKFRAPLGRPLVLIISSTCPFSVETMCARPSPQTPSAVCTSHRRNAGSCAYISWIYQWFGTYSASSPVRWWGRRAS